MELADLVRPVTVRTTGVERTPPPTSRLRALSRFAVLGVALFAVRHLACPPPAPVRPIVVTVAQQASDGDVERAIDEAILVDLALRAGFARSDPVVRERTLKSLEAIDDAADGPSRAIERGLSMGLATKDPVARSRLATSAARTIEWSEPAHEVTDGEVDAYLSRHRAAFTVPGRARFDEIFLSRQKRGDHFDADVAAVAARLHDDPALDPSDLGAASDPPPIAWAGMVDERRLDSLLGSGVGAAVVAAPIHVWSGPIRSSFGAHFVRVVESDASRDAAPPDVRARVVEQIEEDRRRDALRDRLRELRAMYRVSIERGP